MRRTSVVIVLLLVVALVFPATVSAAPARQGGFWHRVHYGETVFSIARWYGISPYAIASANGLGNWNLIFAGQSLWIPWGGWTPGPIGCARSHYVSYGDTLLRIGRWYGVSAWSIASANGIYNLNQIYAGQWLCIP